MKHKTILILTLAFLLNACSDTHRITNTDKNESFVEIAESEKTESRKLCLNGVVYYKWNGLAPAYKQDGTLITCERIEK